MPSLRYHLLLDRCWWTAALPDGSNHVVMVDMNLGYVVFYALFQ